MTQAIERAQVAGSTTAIDLDLDRLVGAVTYDTSHDPFPVQDDF